MVSANVAPASIASLGATLSSITTKVAPDPKLANASSLAAISTLATAANGGVVVPPPIVVPVAPVVVPTATTSTAAPAAPAAPAVPAGTTVTTATPAACLASIGSASIVYASQPNTNASVSSSSPLQALVVTSGTALPVVTDTTWSSTLPIFNVANRNWYTYTAVTNSGCATGTYGSTSILPSTTAYIYTATTATNPLGSFLPTCPTPAQMATSTGTVLVTATTGTTSSQYGYTGNLVNGVIYGFFPTSGATSGSGSALFAGSVTGSSGGSVGLTLPASGGASSSPSFLSGSGSATQTFINFGSTGSNVAITINSVTTNYNVRKNTTNGQIELACQ